MQRFGGIAVAAALVAAVACSRAPESRRYELRGQIVGISPERQEVLVDHEDIPGFMPAMTMGFRATSRNVYEAVRAGDAVSFTLRLTGDGAVLTSIQKTAPP